LSSLPELPDDGRTSEAVKLALDLGADVNASNQAGDTALHGAASHGYAAVMQLLTDHGARMDVKNKRGKTPLDLATAKDDGTKSQHAKDAVESSKP